MSNFLKTKLFFNFGSSFADQMSDHNILEQSFILMIFFQHQPDMFTLKTTADNNKPSDITLNLSVNFYTIYDLYIFFFFLINLT